MNNKTQKTIKILSLIALILFVLISIFVTYKIVLFIKKPNDFQSYIESFGILAPSIYIIFVILQIFFPIIPGEPIELAGGYCFGSLKGTLFCLFGEMIGSIIVLAFTRKFGSKLLELFFKKEKLEKLDKVFSYKNNTKILTLLFLLPGTPKDLLCYFAGLTNINIYSLVIITCFARIPSLVTSTVVGGTLGQQNYMLAIVVFVLTAVISLVGITIFNKIINNKNSK